MPDGKTHETINAVVLIAVLAGFYYMIINENEFAIKYFDATVLLIFSLGYIFATFFLSPDLDIQSKPYKRWGLLKILWWPYKVIFKHRGYSHHPVIGPLSIVLNLAIIVAMVLFIGGFEAKSVPPGFIVPAIAGMVLSMEVHIVSDSFVSKFKSIF
ncbi:MAG: metal-binding protein [Methanolobus sp.]